MVANGPTSPLRVFVYGTLKEGQRNHDRFCRGFVAVREATVRGSLYDLPYGFPALVVPEESILARGTADPLADAEVQRRTGLLTRADAPSPAVYGELFEFDDPEERLPALDALEGFRPDEGGLYERVLVPVTIPETRMVTPAWAYVIGSAMGTYLPGGYWPARS